MAHDDEQRGHRFAEHWRRQVQLVLANLALGEKQHEEIRSLTDQVANEYRGRFLLELLQNASDQATKAELSSSTVHIVRTDDLLCVTNEGEPFDEPGFTAILRGGLSSKSVAKYVGHKGVGFKAVFAVSDRPEVYTAVSRGMPCHAPGGWGFALRADPWEEQTELVERTVRDVLEREPAHAQATAADGDPIALLTDAVRRSAGFRFPLALNEEDAARHVTKLGLGTAEDVQTMVVLPLRGPAEGDAVGHAIDTIVGTGLSRGTAVLFIPTVTTIEIDDRVRGAQTRIGKTTLRQLTSTREREHRK